ncbi:MAG: FAD-dependent oxidoreductase, partial [Pseudomonadota bacterium]
MDGDIDPAQLCQALARRARNAGAVVYRHTPVTGLTQKPDGEWIVHTDKGDIATEHIVNAGGYRCNEVGAMMGVVHPVASMEHQYFLTEPIKAIEEMTGRVPLIRCPTDDFYSRQEKQGLLVGFYEQDCKTWGLDGIDPNFTNALCPNDLDRVMPVLENVFERLPCVAEVGIHTIVNGPITYTPDGVPLVGRIPGKRNAWCITGLRAGLGEGGGHGWLLAQEMVHGEAVYDTWVLDPRRFTRYANVEYTALKAIEDYQNEFRFHRPHEHRPAGRPSKTTPLTPVLEAKGARFAVVNGWERAAFYAPDTSFEETHEFQFNNWEPVVAQEIEAVQTRVGIMEVNGFNRIEIRGAGARQWLDGLMCGRVPRKTGKVGLAYFLTDAGHVRGEATLANLDDETVWYGSAAASENHDWDWLTDRLPRDGSIELTPLTNSHTILVLAGPNARSVLEAAAPRTDWSAAAFPWLSVRHVQIGRIDAVAMSVSFSGELAWEIHVPLEHAAAAYEILTKAGAAHGMAPFGLYATEAMRIEKGYRHWKADLISEFDPFESALDRFVQLDKTADYPGKAALLAKQGQPPRRRFVTLRLDTETAPAHPGDSLMRGEEVVGTVTSAAWGWRVQENLAMAFLSPELAEIGTAVDVLLLGERIPAEVVAPCRYDPKNNRVKG